MTNKDQKDVIKVRNEVFAKLKKEVFAEWKIDPQNARKLGWKPLWKNFGGGHLLFLLKRMDFCNSPHIWLVMQIPGLTQWLC